MNRLSTSPHFAALAAAGLLTALFAVAPVTGAAQQTVAVVVNGQPMTFDQPPIVQAGRVFVPLRSIFQQLGASVVYANGQINATGGGRTVALTIGSTQATVGGQPVTLDVAPFVVGSRTLVPLRFVAQSLGANVNWDDSSSTVTINSGNNRPTRVASNYNTNYVSEAPPELPQYDQPYAPAPNYIWTPGYWAWSGSGYYWVPGTWAQPPQTGLYWTPGYWGENGNGPGYAWNAGYWAPQVGFYGGINYGYGYFGNGYQGGRWEPQGFAYNTAYSNVNRTIVKNVYVSRTVTTTTVVHRVSYNGKNGVQARPTAQQLAAAKDRREMTPAQTKHVQEASQDRSLQYSVNHGKPAVPAVSKPLTAPPSVAKPAAAPKPVVPKPAAAKPAAPPARPVSQPERPAAQPRETVRPENRSTLTPEPVKPPAREAKPAPPVKPATTPAPVKPETKPAPPVKPETKPAPAKPETKPDTKPDTKPTEKPSGPPAHSTR